MKRRFWLYPFIVAVLLVSLPACKKDDSSFFPNTITDFDGNVYHILKIGTQTWMLENLSVTHDRQGNAIANIMDSSLWPSQTGPAYSFYDNATDTIRTYGLLYNWFAASDTAIAPVGYHVATRLDWDSLVLFLGGDSIAGGKLKQADTSTWYNPNLADNSSGFNALPGGFYANDTSSYSTFQQLNFVGYWWTSTEVAPAQASARFILGNSTAVYKNDTTAENWGLSIRCVKSN